MARLTLPDGRVINFPDGLRPDQVSAIAKAAMAQSPAAPPATPPEPAREDQIRRTTAQGIGRGIANVAGMPADLLTGAANGVAGGINSIVSPLLESAINYFGDANIDIPDVPRTPSLPFGGDFIADRMSRSAETLGYDVMDPEEMSGKERLGYNIGDFATQAGIGGAGLAKAAAGKAIQTVNPYLRAYVQNPGKALVGDVTGGAGAGTAITAVDEYQTPEWQEEHPLIAAGSRFGATVLGGGIGSLAPAVAQAPGKAVKAAFDSQWRGTDKVLADPTTGIRPTRRTENQAASFLQGQATDKDAAAREIYDAILFNKEAGGTMPTLGMATDDVGLRYLEKRAALNDAPTLAHRYESVAKDASKDVKRLQVEGADATLPKQIAEKTISDKRAAAEAGVETGGRNLEAADLDEKALADSYRPFAGGADQASMDLDEAIVDKTLRPMTKTKNEKFDAIDPDASTYIPAAEILKALDDIEAGAANLPPSMRKNAVPGPLMSDIRSATSNPEDLGIPMMPFRAATDMRPALSSEAAKARISGDYQKADAIRSIKTATSKAAETLASQGGEAGSRAKDALSYYKDVYAPLFAEGQGGKFRDDLNMEGANRVQTAPTKTAGRFLKEGPGGREAAADLQRILAATPDPRQAGEAAKRYTMDSLSRTVIGADGKVSETALQRWINNRQGMLSQIPEIADEVNGLLRDVRGKSARTNTMKAELEAAKKSQKLTEEEINQSALRFYVGNNPENAVTEIMRSGDPAKNIKEIRSTFGNDRAAEAGFRSAVADHLVKQITNADGEAVSFQKLSSQFKKNEAALTEVFGSDMQYVRQAQRRLEMLSRKNVQGAAGSTTVENKVLIGGMKAFEIVMRMTKGALQGGSEVRKAKLMAEKLPDTTAAANALIKRAALDPRVAKHLLGVSVKEVGTPRWNARLNRLMGWAEAARTSAEGEDE